MLARFIAPLLLLTPVALADCLPDPAVVKVIQDVRNSPCYGIQECLKGQIEKVERSLEAYPANLALHRIIQDLTLAAGDDPAVAREELIESYRNHRALNSETRRYLVARLENDVAGLRTASGTIPWARLDLMRRQAELEGDALVDRDEARELLEGFVAECPDAIELLAGEARQLLVSARWPVWGDVRRQLLEMDPPAWERLGDFLIRAGLLQAEAGDPAQRLLDELEAATGDRYRDSAAYWLYRAHIHLQAKDTDAALEANARARQIDPCRQLSPLQRLSPDESEPFNADWFAGVSQQVLACPPDFDIYQAWMIAVTQQPERIEAETLARIRSAVEDRALGYETPRLAKHLARIDICCTGHDPKAAWATLDALVEKSMTYLERTQPGFDRASLALSIALDAMSYAKLALMNDFPDRADQWRSSAEALFQEHLPTLRQEPRWEGFISRIESVRSEFDWLLARKEERHADAVVHALDARTKRLPWIDMDEVLASWRSAGGTETGFERLLTAWDLELPAQWRGWRRLDKPLPAFELTDLEGRTWTLNEIDGKRTLVNLWAVWCGPCMLELPKVQELHERYRDNPNVQVLTVNLHDAPGVARELMRREGYDFPVLMHGTEESIFDDVGIPRNWLVEGNGIRQWEQTGFVPTEADHWVEDIVSLIGQME